MKRGGSRSVHVSVGGALLLVFAIVSSLGAQQPRHGGELVFAVAQEPPTYDGHREETFGVTHPLAPFYSLLLRVDVYLV